MSAARMQEISPYTGEYFREPSVSIFPCGNLHYSEEYYARRQEAQRDRGTPYPDPRRLGAAKAGRISIHWMETASLFAHPPGGTLRVPFGCWGSPHAARPLLSLRDISPALRGNLPQSPPGSARTRDFLKKIE